jgi:hypothetical protein
VTGSWLNGDGIGRGLRGPPTEDGGSSGWSGFESRGGRREWLAQWQCSYVVVVVVCLRRGPGMSLRRPFEGRLGVGANNIMCPPDY